jgi:dihydroanticapsin dehydrogenase
MSRDGALAGKTALVTGGCGGIGRAICARFAKEGARVVAADLSPGSTGGDGDLPDGVSFRILDVTQEDEVRSVLSDLEAAQGGLDVLVNAAGIEIEKTIEETSLED